MDDEDIVELYWKRSESAVSETELKYGRYLYGVSYNIVNNSDDASECVNDVYREAWNAIPPNRPAVLSTFLGKISRRISIDRLRKANAEKRGGGELPLVLDELEECVGGGEVESEVERREIINALNRFLGELSPVARGIFLSRYWYMDSIKDIAGRFGFSESRVASTARRARLKLRARLEKENLL